MTHIFRAKLSKIDWIVARIIVVYILFGLLWIFFSDSILSNLVSDREQYTRISIYKGGAYVFFTAVLLYLLVRKTLLQQSRTEQTLQISEERWKFALEGSGEGVWDWVLETDQVFRSGQWYGIYGYSEKDIAPTAAAGRKLIHPEDLACAIEDINAYLEGRTPVFTSEFRLLCKDGSWKWTLSRGMVVSSTPDGKPLRMIGTHTDISERKHSEAEIFRLANYDAITGLPNRVLFLNRFEQEIKKAERTGQSITLMYLDLDRFKEINDTLGHDIGDLLLKKAAKRLVNCVRVIDSVARLGGDEFTIILNNLNGPGSIEHVAQEIIRKLAEPFQLRNELVYITASIGITIFPEDATEVDVLLKNADQALYAAKYEGRNCYHYFTPSMQQAAIARMRITNDLRVALNADQFRVYYQPIVELATGEVYKAEALIRWQHPAHGLVSPHEFIPIAEDTGLIVEIGEYVFAQAANQVVKWRNHHPNFQISVNKSPVQFKSDNRPDTSWMNHLQSLGLPGDSIVVEITEGLLLDANPRIAKHLLEFHEAGIQLAIDDFGTGYSSLAYLKKFEIDYLKIDRSFTRNIEPGSEDMAICEAIIVMSHKLGIKVIAEGVETVEQRDLLRAAGCDYAQGYLYSRPVPADEFEQLFCQESTKRYI